MSSAAPKEVRIRHLHDGAVSATAGLQKGASDDRMFYRLTVDVKGW
ncbi:MAG: hypothetical protein IJI73_08795 [Kiritimatiellae bacterium]|nr:hypothetical protein [Kiritimatiellia bacterium]